jgi:hypothetical protein
MEHSCETRRDKRENILALAAIESATYAEISNRMLVELRETFKQHLFVCEKPLRLYCVVSIRFVSSQHDTENLRKLPWTTDSKP